MYVRIAGRDYTLISFEMEKELDTVASFSVEILLEEISSDIFDLVLEDIEVYFKDKLIISGFVVDRPSYELNDQEKIVVSINGNDSLGRLSLKRGKSTAHYQDQLVSGILSDLIGFIGGWTINYINYPAVATDKITIDLRGKETLWSQLIEVVKAVPNLHIRYAGNNTLEVGEFGTVYEQADNILSLSLEEKNVIIYKLVESYGGFSATERINLNLALLDPRTVLHPDYAQFPIQTDGTFYYVVNTAITNGYEVTKKFDLQKTKNDDVPENTQKYQAAYALWLKTVSFMKRHDDSDIYSLSFLRHYDYDVRLGDKLLIKHPVTQMFYDKRLVLFEIDEELMIYRASLSFDETYGDELVWEFELTTGNYGQNEDSDSELYERLEVLEERTTEDTIQISPVVFVTDSHNGAELTDCSPAGIINGKTFTFTPTNIPNWATSVFYGVVDRTPTNLIYVQTQAPLVSPVTDLELCVAPANGDWTTLTGADIYTISVIFYYT